MREHILPNMISRFEQDPIMDPRYIDLTIEKPDLVKRLFEPRFSYAQVVENEVTAGGEIVRTILPNMSTVLDRFLKIWVPQEEGHADVIGTQMDNAGIDRLAPRQSVSRPMELAGKLASVSPGIHDAIEFVYYVYAGLGEMETRRYYARFSHDLHKIGEVPLARSFSTMGGQENGHLNFYATAAREKREQLRPWQKRLGGAFLEHMYTPVGTHKSQKDSARRRHFGQVVFDVSGRKAEGIAEFTAPIEELANSLLSMGGELKPLVRRGYEECVREYKASILA